MKSVLLVEFHKKSSWKHPSPSTPSQHSSPTPLTLPTSHSWDLWESLTHLPSPLSLFSWLPPSRLWSWSWIYTTSSNFPLKLPTVFSIIVLTSSFISVFTHSFSKALEWPRLVLLLFFEYAKNIPTSRPLHLPFSRPGTLLPFTHMAYILDSFTSLSNVGEILLTMVTTTHTTPDPCIPDSLSLPYTSS